MAGILAGIRRSGMRSVGAFTPGARAYASSNQLFMSTTSDETTTTTTPLQILPRIKAADASEPSDGPVVIKGWVRTVRKQKTLAFVEVNDGSNMGGIQCVLSFENIDEETMAGK
jgi:hypothetical protein